MTSIRVHMSAFLIVLMLFTGQALAMARGMPLSVGTMEICSGQHTVIVAIDANGEPTHAQHHCLDCTLLALGLADTNVGPAAPESVAFAFSALFDSIESTTNKILRLNARAPPSLV